MAIREILEVPDPRLKTVSAPVTVFDDELRTLVADMFETMYAAPGIGLAAIQVGVASRVLVIDLQPDDTDAEPEPCDHDGHHHVHYPVKKEPRVFVNPVILGPSKELATYQEGLPLGPRDLRRRRPPRDLLRPLPGPGRQGPPEEDMDGMMATCLQHEMDHLEGILFIDHLSRLKRQMALKKLQKMRQAA